MNINLKDKVTLSDGMAYIVVSKIAYQRDIYYYLIEQENYKNIKFLREKSENSSLVEVNDTNLLQILLPLFLKSFKHIDNST